MSSKRKLKKKRKINIKKRDNGVSYVCCNCGVEEKIPVGVLEEFDELYPEQLLFGGHQFQCEKCGTGIMVEKESRSIVSGYGLFEDVGKDSE